MKNSSFLKESDHRFISHFTKSRYMGIVYNDFGAPIHAFNTDTHYYHHLLLEFMSDNVSSFYQLPDNFRLSQLCDNDTAYSSRNKIEAIHLIPDFTIERPLSSIRFMKLDNESFLGVISFSGFIDRLRNYNERPVVLATGDERIFGFNGALARILQIDNEMVLAGKKISELFEFIYPDTADTQKEDNYTSQMIWRGIGSFPGVIVDGGELSKTDDGCCLWTNRTKQVSFVELSGVLDVYNSDFEILLSYSTDSGAVPGIVMRGNRKREFVFPDHSGYVFVKPENEKFQFKRGADKVRLFDVPVLDTRAGVTLKIRKHGIQFEFFVNNNHVGDYCESSPIKTPAENRMFLFMYPESSILIREFRFSKKEAETCLPPFPVASYKTHAKTLYFNVIKGEEILDNINCDRYTFEDVTTLYNNINTLTEEKKHLAMLLLENRHLGESDAMHSIRKEVAKVADTSVSILIEGETGVGKEVLARTIHESSSRRAKPFVKIDCSTIPENLMESELFGHEKGAFTGALTSHAGRFEQANGGTLFLDEVSNLTLTVQAKLLAVIQDRVINRIGGIKPIALDIRIISASNKPLLELASRGTFRTDLYYRIAEFTFFLPPLRERMDDLPFLAAKFLSEAVALYKVTEKKLSAKATEKMLTHVWPGNIRELRNVVYKAVILAESNLITEKEIDFEVANGINLGKNSRPEITAEKLRAAIAECSGNMSKVAEKLGISRVTLYKKLKKFNISDSK